MQIIKVGSFNTRTLKENDKLLELETAQEKEKIDILGISEIKRAGENILKTKKGNLFCHFGKTPGQKGVGVLISQKWGGKLIAFEGITERLALAEFDPEQGRSLTLIQVYASTTAAKEEEMDEFYTNLTTNIQNLPKNIKF